MFVWCVIIELFEIYDIGLCGNVCVFGVCWCKEVVILVGVLYERRCL